MTKLYWSSKDDISLEKAISDLAENLQDAVGLLYSPHCCEFVKMNNNTVINSSGLSVDLKLVFEARLFNEDFELRWLKFPSKKGKAVILSEKANFSPNFKGKIEEMETLNEFCQTYLLWGEGTQNAKILNGWSRLATARIGKLDVPISGIKSQERVQLLSKEYLKKIDEFGNVAVVEERLIKLQSLNNKDGENESEK